MKRLGVALERATVASHVLGTQAGIDFAPIVVQIRHSDGVVRALLTCEAIADRLERLIASAPKAVVEEAKAEEAKAETKFLGKRK
jgi:hypothetical protein